MVDRLFKVLCNLKQLTSNLTKRVNNCLNLSITLSLLYITVLRKLKLAMCCTWRHRELITGTCLCSISSSRLDQRWVFHCWPRAGPVLDCLRCWSDVYGTALLLAASKYSPCSRTRAVQEQTPMIAATLPHSPLASSSPISYRCMFFPFCNQFTN